MERVALYGELAEHYDRIYSAKDYEGEAQWLTTLALRSCPSARTLLDVACGTGRHLATFRRKFDAEGIDASAPMLAIARRRLGPSIPLTCGDMRSFQSPRKYDVLVCLFSAIGYLRSRSDRRRAFGSFYDAVGPGGVVLVEGWILPSEFRSGSVHLQTYDGPDAKIARVSTATRIGRRTRIQMDYLVGTPGAGVRHWSEVHVNALVEAAEMLETMRTAGFRARFLRTGPYRSRGLYVGLKPPASGGVRRRPTGRRSRRV
jgi:SAM-dependent methyltransferase